MHVPPHISAFGNSKGAGFAETLASAPSAAPSSALLSSDIPAVAAKMNVPDRIIFGGSNRLMGQRQEAADVFANNLDPASLKQALNALPTTLTVDHILNSEPDGDGNEDESEHSRANSISQNSNYFGEDEVTELRQQLSVLTNRINKLEKMVSSTRKFNLLSFSASAIALIFSVLLLLKRSAL